MELRPTSAGNGSSVTLAESKFLQNLFGGLGLLAQSEIRKPFEQNTVYEFRGCGPEWGCPVLGAG